MPDIKKVRLALFILVALAHLLLIFMVVFKAGAPLEEEPGAEVMKLVDLQEEPPPPPASRPPSPLHNTTEAIAQNMIETDEPPPTETYTGPPPPPAESIDYLPMHRISSLPAFNERELLSALVYPPIAQRSNVEGLVYLELFVDTQGEVRRVTVLREDPEGRGFGEAAAAAFRGMKGTPAQANGAPVACRYRYPVRFRLRS